MRRQQLLTGLYALVLATTYSTISAAIETGNLCSAPRSTHLSTCGNSSGNGSPPGCTQNYEKRFTAPINVVPVFWGSNVASDTVSGSYDFLVTLLGSSWGQVLRSEYGTSVGAVSRNAIITPAVSTGSTVTRPQIEAELNWQVQNGHLPSGGNYLFVVYFPASVAPTTPYCDSNGQNCQNVPMCTNNPFGGGGHTCAYHEALSTGSGGPVTYAVIPDHASECSINTCSNGAPSSYAAMTVAESHEIAEAFTDPDVTTGFRTRITTSARPTPHCAGAEIGDICQSETVQLYGSIGPYVQTIWSNKANACVSSVGALSDVNGDGRSDILLTGGQYWSTIPVAFSNGDGTYSAVNAGETSGDTGFATYATQPYAQKLAGDFDGDGHTDAALIGGADWQTIPVAFSNGDGTYRGTNLGVTGGDTGITTYAQQGPVAVAGDFNGDGYSDVALVGGTSSNNQPWHTFPVAFSNGDGTFRGTNGLVTMGYDATIAAADAYALDRLREFTVSGDFNDDGLDDIAFVLAPPYSNNGIVVALSNGDGTFNGILGSEVSGDTGFSAYAGQGAHAVAGDFDGDGRADIALTGPNWNTIPIAFSVAGRPGSFSGTNRGVASGFTAFPQASNQGPYAVAGDFNGDGLSDILLAGAWGWSTMPIAFSNGDGSYNATNSGSVSGFTGFITAAGQGLPVTW